MSPRVFFLQWNYTFCFNPSYKFSLLRPISLRNLLTAFKFLKRVFICSSFILFSNFTKSLSTFSHPLIPLKTFSSKMLSVSSYQSTLTRLGHSYFLFNPLRGSFLGPSHRTRVPKQPSEDKRREVHPNCWG